MRRSHCWPTFLWKSVSFPHLISLLLSRLLLPRSTWKTYRVAKGAKFATQRKKQATELTSEMIARCVCGGGAQCRGSPALQQQQQQLRGARNCSAVQQQQQQLGSAGGFSAVQHQQQCVVVAVNC
jgi:hypothetical protein